MSKISNRRWHDIQKLRACGHISLKNDSRVFCQQAKRTKFLYENENKTKKALKFNKEIGNVRYYACDSCMGYHLTSQEQRFSGKRVL